MPVYVYKAVKDGCEYCSNGFEQIQRMSDKALTKCPICGAKIHKCPAMVNGGVPKLSDGNLRDKGFTKLVRRDKGVYERTT